MNFEVGDRVRVILGLSRYKYDWDAGMDRSFGDGHPEGTVISTFDRDQGVRVQAAYDGLRWNFSPSEIELVEGSTGMTNDLARFPRKKER